MNDFFAADPSSCDNSSELRFLLGHFGPQAGRYLAAYPTTWAKDVVEHCEGLGTVEGERVKLLLRRAREKAALLGNKALLWDERSDWIGNFLNLARQRPGEFAQAIVPRLASAVGMATIDDLDLSPTADESIQAVSSEYVRVSRTLLVLGPELVFVDPYLNPCKSDRRGLLVAMFGVAAQGKCRRITCWARHSDIVGERRHSWEEVQAGLSTILSEARWPADREFRYVLVDDATAKTKMHPRYMFSIKGGIRYDQGFQCLSKGRRNDVSPLGRSLHEEVLRIYHEGEHDMRIEKVFESPRSQSPI
jgi:hypothetical protein